MLVGLFCQLVSVVLDLLQTILKFTGVLSGPKLVHHALDLSSVLSDLLDVGAACLYEAGEVPWGGAVRLCFAVGHDCRRLLVSEAKSFGCRQTQELVHTNKQTKQQLSSQMCALTTYNGPHVEPAEAVVGEPTLGRRSVCNVKTADLTAHSHLRYNDSSSCTVGEINVQQSQTASVLTNTLGNVESLKPTGAQQHGAGCIGLFN